MESYFFFSETINNIFRHNQLLRTHDPAQQISALKYERAINWHKKIYLSNITDKTSHVWSSYLKVYLLEPDFRQSCTKGSGTCSH